MSIKSVAFLEICHDGWALCLQRYTGVPVDRDIFCHDTNIVYWTSYRDIYDTFTYASTNMGKQSSISAHPMHGDFSNKLTRKIHAEQCLALYSRLGLSAVQTSEPMSKTRGNTLLVLLLRNVSYRVSYRDNYIGICIISWINVSLQAYWAYPLQILL